MIELKQLFELYNKCSEGYGVIGISSTRIQLNTVKFKELFVNYTHEIKVTNCEKYIQLSIMQDDIKFITLI